MRLDKAMNSVNILRAVEDVHEVVQDIKQRAMTAEALVNVLTEISVDDLGVAIDSAHFKPYEHEETDYDEKVEGNCVENEAKSGSGIWTRCKKLLCLMQEISNVKSIVL